MFIAIGIFFVFLLLGMPVAFSIGLSGFSFFLIRNLPMTVLVQKSISTSQSFTMLAIPLFILAGNLMNSCGITKRLMRFANACTGHMYGNIGQVSCLMSTLMGGVSGSAVADASMECRILGPEMNRLGYDRGWSAAINGLSGLIVATIPQHGSDHLRHRGRSFHRPSVHGWLGARHPDVRPADAGRHLERPPLWL